MQLIIKQQTGEKDDQKPTKYLQFLCTVRTIANLMYDNSPGGSTSAH